MIVIRYKTGHTVTIQARDLSEALQKLMRNTSRNKEQLSIDGSFLNGVNFHQQRCNFSNFRNSNFEKCDFSGVKMHNVDFTNTDFVDCNLDNAELNGCDIKGATFRNCKFFDTNLTNCLSDQKTLFVSSAIVGSWVGPMLLYFNNSNSEIYRCRDGIMSIFDYYSYRGPKRAQIVRQWRAS